jgi:hypothetical protein
MSDTEKALDARGEAMGDGSHSPTAMEKRGDAIAYGVRAVDCHDELVEVLKDLLALAEGEFGWAREDSPCKELCSLAQCQEHGCIVMKLNAAAAALAKAEAL